MAIIISDNDKEEIVNKVLNFMQSKGISGAVKIEFEDDFDPSSLPPGGGGICTRVALPNGGSRVVCPP